MIRARISISVLDFEILDPGEELEFVGEREQVGSVCFWGMASSPLVSPRQAWHQPRPPGRPRGFLRFRRHFRVHWPGRLDAPPRLCPAL